VRARAWVGGYTGVSFCLRTFSLTNQLFNAPPYCHLRPLASPHFSALSHTPNDFRKNVTEYKMCVLIFSTTFIGNVFHSKKSYASYCHKCENVMYSNRYSCRILMKLEFSSHIFEKDSNIKFNQNPSSGSRVVACGRTNRQTPDEANSRFSQFCERA
jgi:hypothetical protein